MNADISAKKLEAYWAVWRAEVEKNSSRLKRVVALMDAMQSNDFQALNALVKGRTNGD